MYSYGSQSFEKAQDKRGREGTKKKASQTRDRMEFQNNWNYKRQYCVHETGIRCYKKGYTENKK